MKNQRQTNLLIRSSLILALAFAVLSPINSQSADPAAPAEDTPSEGNMMDHCKKMMEHMQQHMERGKDSLSKCPMMKSKGHKKHHEKTN